MHAAFDREVPIRFDLEADGVRYTEPAPPAADTLIIHGNKDESVPVADSRQYAADFAERVQLVEVDAGHDLNEHLALIWSHVQSFLLEP
jgi:pimeloyl-ACP methyl ester carboxylesterase